MRTDNAPKARIDELTIFATMLSGSLFRLIKVFSRLPRNQSLVEAGKNLERIVDDCYIKFLDPLKKDVSNILGSTIDFLEIQKWEEENL